MDLDYIKKIPKVLLHEHLDGAIRSATIIDLAFQHNIKLPFTDEFLLANWFIEQSRQRDLEKCLATFRISCAVMQWEEALQRVAYEFIEDMYNDGIIYVEVRFCPYFHTEQGLSLADVVKAVISGLSKGHLKYGVEFGLIICGMRNLSPEINLELAKLAQAFIKKGVVGYDFAGIDLHYPLINHRIVTNYLKENQIPFTVHVGEMAPCEYILEAINLGATRLGHCAKILDESLSHQSIISNTLDLIKKKNIHIEVNITSNICTGAAYLNNHPFIKLFNAGFNVSLNTDDTLMFGSSLSNEYVLVGETYDLNVSDIKQLNINAAKSSFLGQSQKAALINKVILG